MKILLRIIFLFTFILLLPLQSHAEEKAREEKARIDNSEPSLNTNIKRETTDLDIARSPESRTVVNTNDVISFNMAPLQVELTADQKQFLKKYVLERLSKNPDLRLGIQSLAHTNKDDKFESARIALARGLEVRQFFLDNKIPAKRLIIQPLGVSDEQGDDDGQRQQQPA